MLGRCHRVLRCIPVGGCRAISEGVLRIFLSFLFFSFLLFLRRDVLKEKSEKTKIARPKKRMNNRKRTREEKEKRDLKNVAVPMVAVRVNIWTGDSARSKEEDRLFFPSLRADVLKIR